MREEQTFSSLTPQQLASCFESILSGESTSIRNMEMELLRLSSDPQFMPILLQVPFVEGIQQPIAKMAMIYTLTYTKKIIKSSNQAQINITAQQMLNYLSRNDVILKHRQEVAHSLQHLINADTHNIILAAFLPNFLDLINQAQNETDNNVNFNFIALYASIIIDAKYINLEQIINFVKSTMVGFAKLAIRVLQYVKSEENMLQSYQLSIVYSNVLKQYMRKFLLINIGVVDVLFDVTFIELFNLVLSITIKTNQISSCLFYLNSKEEYQPIHSYFHRLKSNYIKIFTSMIRVLMASVGRQIRCLDCPIMKVIPQYVPYFVKDVEKLLDLLPYFQLKPGALDVVEQVYGFLTICLRTNMYYSLFAECRNILIHKCIFKTLALSPNEYSNYYQQPEEFLNTLIHIFDIDTVAMGKKQPNEENQDEEIQYYSTLKTVSAMLLETICTYLDGVLSEVFYFTGQVLEDLLNTEYSKNLMLIVMCVLKNLTKERRDIHSKLSIVLMTFIDSLPYPTKSTEEPESISFLYEDIQFGLALLTISRYYGYLIQMNDNIFEKICNLAQSLIENPKVEAVPKLVAYDIVASSMQFEEMNVLSVRYLFVFSTLLKKQSNVSMKFLECLRGFFKHNDFQFKDQQSLVTGTVRKLITFLINQKQKNNEGLLAITKEAWLVIEQIAESGFLIPKMQGQIEAALEPIYEHIGKNKDLHYEEHLFKIITIFIKKSSKITENHLKAFEIVPCLYYQNNNQNLLHNAFEFLQCFIFFGAPLLSVNLSFVKKIILMCTDAMEMDAKRHRTEADNCEGVLVLQSLIIACGACFDEEMWNILASSTTKRLHSPPINYQFLRANVVTNLGLILMYAHKFFQNNDCETILNMILKEYSCFSYQKCSKIFVITLCELITLVHLEFIQRRFQQLLDCLITLLQIVNMKKDEAFLQAELDAEQIHFSKLQKQVQNNIKNMNEYQYFRQQIKKVKQNFPELLERTYNQLPKVKQQYFREVLSLTRIGDDSRKIFKLKR